MKQIIYQYFGEPKNYRFKLMGRFPRRVSSSAKIHPKDLRMRVTVYPALSRYLKRDLGVKRVRVKPVGLKMIAVGGGKRWTRRESHRWSPWKRLSRSHNVHLRSNGRVSIPVRGNPSRVKLLLPKRFSVKFRYRPPMIGIVRKADWKCHARKSVTRRNRTIGTVKVR